MLEDYKKMYEECAGSIVGWKKINKNDLCNLYIENEHNEYKKQSYLSAIICRYWSLIPKYYGISKNVVTIEDVYEWLVDAIMYALEHRTWKIEGSTIYNDPNGPDKVINRCMKCRRLTYYQAINRQKRKDGQLYLSLDSIQDEIDDCSDIFTDDESSVNSFSFMLDEYIKSFYNAGEYFIAFMIDSIAYNSVFTYSLTDQTCKFSEKKLENAIMSYDDTDIKLFADRYGLDFNDVKRKWRLYVWGMSRSTISSKMKEGFDILRNSKYFSEEYASRCCQTF